MLGARSAVTFVDLHDLTSVTDCMCVGMVKIWGAQTGALHHTFEGSGSSIEWLCWHPRGDVVIAGTEDYMAFMWNAGSGVTMQVRGQQPGLLDSEEARCKCLLLFCESLVKQVSCLYLFCHHLKKTPDLP